MHPIELTLPFPPSTNTVWRNVNGRTLLSRKGREFRRQVAATVALQHRGVPMDGRLSVLVLLTPPDKRKRDIDNYGGKALLDAITHAGVWIDDEQIDELIIQRGDIKPGGGCLVRIHQTEPA